MVKSENFVLLAGRFAGEKNRIGYSFRREKNKFARRLRRKGIRLLVDSGGRE